ncbi:hypothetical protein [Aquincola tertiaricarbonis]|uniref:hypothetical protein n=1 Tax=Aquincola tertiaricarbonis TaxID=391953 RepID=UPI0006150F5D|nr:hypothetical protein [Aquincola tertiaricarbonis]
MHHAKRIGLLVLGAALAGPVLAAAQGAATLAAPLPGEHAATTTAATAPSAGAPAESTVGVDLALFFGGLGAIGFVTLRRGRGDA